ncbi:DUF4844 domain-containing protein [Asticcacaulis excentricus]|uniref:Uncharacterized protein n=1 Tax=Asticcacaulis excentricus (strain ATCC 15261 / DSM 4724 / KCTC 12464 / NCIMB 9791 / VKM B-1370 / CB 48) TaxID=573065 RepID=E8RRL4_ASTEC|nr:DUF4844 domain-containing protein [Asticcacaulis excentricus]ADU13459.1 hypothetical protein Astex_1795 [Asticcacaulis excentricus CB 48]
MSSRLDITDDTITALKEFWSLPKFGPDDTRYPAYVGFLPASLRPAAETELNAFVDQLIATLPETPNKASVLKLFAQCLLWFAGHDTEDRNRICDYLVEIMDIIGLESSDGLLNNFMYA